MALLLIVEEDEDFRLLAQRVLSAHGDDVVAFGDAQAAMAWLRGHWPDLVLVSGGRHGESAQERLDALRAAGMGGRQIVLTAGVGAVSRVREALGGEVRAVLPEPAGIEDLEEVIRSVPLRRGTPGTVEPPT